MPPYSIPPYKIVVITLPLEGLPFVLYCFKIKLQLLANQMALTAHKFSDCFVMQMLIIDAEQGHVVVFENCNGVHCYSFVGISSSEGESETGESEVEDSAEPAQNFPKKQKNWIVSSFYLMILLNTSLQKQIFMHNRNFRETCKGLRSGNQ